MRKGLLHRMDVAFSRDSTPRAYVQDRLRDAGKDLSPGSREARTCMSAATPSTWHRTCTRHSWRSCRRTVASSATLQSRTSGGWPTIVATCGTCTDHGRTVPVERIKRESRLLRGTLVESLADPLTGAIREDDTALIKFHGSYQQDDRDIREERRHQKLEPAYSFMIRTRLPGACARRGSGSRWTRSPAVTATARSGSPRARHSSCTGHQDGAEGDDGGDQRHADRHDRRVRRREP